MAKPMIHPTADISPNATIGEDTKVWNYTQIRENAKIGKECIIAKSVYIDHGVVIGDRVKIQNNVSIYHGATIEGGVFIGPHVCFTNDPAPRAINPDGTLKTGGAAATDWQIGKILIKEGASIGANTTILPNVAIGRFALVGAGSVVTKNVSDFAIVFGNPATFRGTVCRCCKKASNTLQKEPWCNNCKDFSNIVSTNLSNTRRGSL